MFVISTRNFPPEIGGIQSLMGGLSLSLLKHGPVKVFAEETTKENKFDKNSALWLGINNYIKKFFDKDYDDISLKILKYKIELIIFI